MASSSSTIHLSYLYAQKLNNNAALFVEIGQYDRAIASLSKALKLWRAHNVDNKIPADRDCICMCPHCTPDGCVVFSDINDPELDISNASSDRIINNFRQPSGQHDFSDSFYKNDYDIVIRIKKVENDDEEQMDFGCGYMHQKLIRMPCKSLLKGHNMGPALPLIITFNLGIAYHLSAITSTNRAKIEKTLQLYQVANNCLEKYLRDTNNNQYYSAMMDETSTTIQFEMILCNNLSHMYRFLGDRSKHRQCIQQLISIMMCVVDNKADGRKHLRCIGLEGFFRNITPMILTAHCADVA